MRENKLYFIGEEREQFTIMDEERNTLLYSLFSLNNYNDREHTIIMDEEREQAIL